MATRWLKWNESTHIFEYSTDGVNYNPLPLNASILNEGSISDALLSSNIPRKDGANVFTNALPISLDSSNPVLQFRETDQGADAKNWRVGAEGAEFKLDKLSDALASTNLLKLNRDGILSVLAQAAGVHQFSLNVNGALEVLVRNLSAGASALSALKVGNDTDASAGRLLVGSSGSSLTVPYGPNTVTLESILSGGLNLNAGHVSGEIRFFTGGVTNPRLRLTSSGSGIFADVIFERNRLTPIGDWINIPYSASNFTAASGTWTVSSGNVTTLSYTLIGSSMVLTIHIENTSISATTSDLRIALPFTIARTAITTGQTINNGTVNTGVIRAITGESFVRLYKDTSLGNWAAGANNGFRGQITLAIS